MGCIQTDFQHVTCVLRKLEETSTCRNKFWGDYFCHFVGIFGLGKLWNKGRKIGSIDRSFLRQLFPWKEMIFYINEGSVVFWVRHLDRMFMCLIFLDSFDKPHKIRVFWLGCDFLTKFEIYVSMAIWITSLVSKRFFCSIQ